MYLLETYETTLYNDTLPVSTALCKTMKSQQVHKTHDKLTYYLLGTY